MIIPAHELPLLEPYATQGARVLEHGNKKNPSGIYRDWYEARGCAYTSLDINGRDGAIKQDVRQPFDFGRFDVVTNFGFSEHVSVQAPFWRNAYNATAVGGVMVGTLPKPHHWPHHGWSYWHPMEEFYREWAELNGMEILALHDCGPGDPIKRMWGFVMRRLTHADHVWRPRLAALFWKNPNWQIPDDDTVYYGAA